MYMTVNLLGTSLKYMYKPFADPLAQQNLVAQAELHYIYMLPQYVKYVFLNTYTVFSNNNQENKIVT